MRSSQVIPSLLSVAKATFGDGKSRDDSHQITDHKQAKEQEQTVSHFRNYSFMKSPRTILKGHAMPVRCLGFLVVPNSDRTLIFSGGEDKLVFVWSLKTGEKLAELKGHTQRVISISAFSRDGYDPLLISASWDEDVRIWPLKPIFDLGDDFNNNSDQTAALSQQISSMCKVLKGHTSRIFGLTVGNQPDGKPFIASGSSDSTIRLWSLPEGDLLYVVEDKANVTWNLCVRFWFLRGRGSLQGPAIISGCKNSTVRVWLYSMIASSNNSKARMDDVDELSHRSTNSDDETEARISPKCCNKNADLVIRGNPSAVHFIAPFDYQDVSLVATISKDTDIRVFSLTTGELMKTLRGHRNAIASLAAVDVSNSRGGAILISCSRKGNSTRVWKYSTGECLRRFKGHIMDVYDVELFSSPDTSSDDLIIVSASRDTTVRTWLYTSEKSLKEYQHGRRVKIRGMGVHHNGEDSLVVTGADDGMLRAWRTRRDEGNSESDALKWKVHGAHEHQILAVTVYDPLCDDNGQVQAKAQWPKYLSEPLIISACRNGHVRVSHIGDGQLVIPIFHAHSKVVTSLCTCSGVAGISLTKCIDPFLVTGSEDNTAIVWSMVDFSQLYVLIGHIFDVTSLAVYVPTPITLQQQQRSRYSTSAGGSIPPTPSRLGSFVMDPGVQLVNEDFDPVIITGGMDQTVRLWDYASGDCIAVLNNAESHVTCVTCVNIDDTQARFTGPMVLAGDGSGTIWVWSLDTPFTLLCTLMGHFDEIKSVHSLNSTGMYPILLSGSLDCTVKVWNLNTMTLFKTVEGHTADVTEVAVLDMGGADLALVSASLDTTARVEFGFMEATLQNDMVMQLFQFDLYGINIHVTADSNSAFPRITHSARSEGPELFFGTYAFLFKEALRRGRPDFIAEFLGQSVLGLLRSNRSETGGEIRKELGEAGLLRMALEKGDLKAVGYIISCWCNFFTAAPDDYIHDSKNARISMEDMLMLSKISPGDFQQLICSIRLVPVKGKQPPPGAYFLYERESDQAVVLSCMPLSFVDNDEAGPMLYAPQDRYVQAWADNYVASEFQYAYLPLLNAVHMNMIHAYTNTCKELDSVDIFNSDVGKLSLAFAWRHMGLKVHKVRMEIYVLYVFIGTASLLTFSRIKTYKNTSWVSYLLIAAQLALDAYFMREEGMQLYTSPQDYVASVWNILDVTVVVTNTFANIIRLAYDRDTQASQVLLCITSIASYFNILYYLRAFEATGPLVSMILRISQDMKFLIVVVVIVLCGFSQAFWIVSQDDSSLPFGSIGGSLLNSFVFMLGGFDPTAFNGLSLAPFAIAMSCLYMLIVSILLLNLLIALMGDSYGSVREKGLAQWKLEQAQIITEMKSSMSDENRNCTSTVYFRSSVALTVADSFDDPAVAQLKETVQEMKKAQEAMSKMLEEQNERMQHTDARERPVDHEPAGTDGSVNPNQQPPLGRHGKFKSFLSRSATKKSSNFF